MKIKWHIEGAGCPFQQCGLHRGYILTIPDDELPSDVKARERAIEDWVEDEFSRNIYPTWETAEGDGS